MRHHVPDHLESLPEPAWIGPWRVVRPLSSPSASPSSEVFEVQGEGGETRALKRHLRPRRGEDPAVRARNERRALHELYHLNIVTSHGHGVDDDGAPFLLLEFIDGVHLDDFVDDSPILSRATPPTTTTEAEQVQLADPARLLRLLRPLRSVASAMSALNNAQILHRWLAPRHILVNSDGAAVLVDFAGVCRAPYENDGGIVQGDFRYLSPEQALGGGLDLRSELYSFGVILWELLAGRHPFDAETDVAFAYHHARKQPPSLQALSPLTPARLTALAEGLLQKEPRRRPQDINEVIAVLDEVGDALERTVRARPSTTAGPLPPPPSPKHDGRVQIDDDIAAVPPVRK